MLASAISPPPSQTSPKSNPAVGAANGSPERPAAAAEKAVVDVVAPVLAEQAADLKKGADSLGKKEDAPAKRISKASAEAATVEEPKKLTPEIVRYNLTILSKIDPKHYVKIGVDRNGYLNTSNYRGAYSLWRNNAVGSTLPALKSTFEEAFTLLQQAKENKEDYKTRLYAEGIRRLMSKAIKGVIAHDVMRRDYWKLPPIALELSKDIEIKWLEFEKKFPEYVPAKSAAAAIKEKKPEENVEEASNGPEAEPLSPSPTARAAAKSLDEPSSDPATPRTAAKSLNESSSAPATPRDSKATPRPPKEAPPENVIAAARRRSPAAEKPARKENSFLDRMMKGAAARSKRRPLDLSSQAQPLPVSARANHSDDTSENAHALPALMPPKTKYPDKISL